MKYVCVGHATYDTTLPVNGYPKENLKYRIKEKKECGGGPASNSAYLLAKWGCDTSFVGVIGNDYYGQCIVRELNHIGVNTEYLEKNSDIETDSSYIICNMENGSRTILTSKSAKITRLSNPVEITNADYILVDGEHYETAKEVLENNKNAISVIDAGRCNEEVITLGKMATYFICSKDFAEEFTKIKLDSSDRNNLVRAYEILKANFPGIVIITLEAEGSFTKTDTYKIIPSIKVKAIDSTGAGDIFHASFLYFITHTKDLEKSIRLASITSAISVTRVGSRYAIPKLKEVLERFHEDDVI